MIRIFPALLGALALLAFGPAHAAEPASDEPASDEPTSDEPTSDEPDSDEPTSDEPTSDEPASDESASDEPTSDEPASDEPASDESASDEPASEEVVHKEEGAEEPEAEEAAGAEPPEAPEPGVEAAEGEEAESEAASPGGPVIVLAEEDKLAKALGVISIGQNDTSLFAGLWEKGFLEGKEGKKVVIGGYAETEYHNNFEGYSKFDMHRLVLFVYATLNKHISFAAEIEWEHGGTPRKANGQLNAGEVLLEYATADFKFDDWLGVRAGIILVPFGSFNLRHDAPTRDLGVRPMVITNIVPSTWFEAGVGLFGTVPLPNDVELDYEVYMINGLDSKLYDGLGTRAARGSLGEDNNDGKAIIGHIGFRPLNTLEFGVSGYRGAYDPESTRYVNMIGADMTARIGPVELLGEFAAVGIDPGFDEGWAEPTRSPVPEQMLGGYGQVNVNFFPKPWRAKLPGEMRDEMTFTASVRYGEIDTKVGTVSRGDRSRLTVGLNVRPIEAFVFKNEFLFESDGSDGTLERFFNPGWDPEIRYVGSIAMMF